MVKDGLILFWKDCVDRRKTQLVYLKESWNYLNDNQPITMIKTEADKRQYNKYGDLLTEQQNWIEDADEKLAHAKRMLAFLEAAQW